jgi:hypothetical protein
VHRSPTPPIKASWTFAGLFLTAFNASSSGEGPRHVDAARSSRLFANPRRPKHELCDVASFDTPSSW